MAFKPDDWQQARLAELGSEAAYSMRYAGADRSVPTYECELVDTNGDRWHRGTGSTKSEALSDAINGCKPGERPKTVAQALEESRREAEAMRREVEELKAQVEASSKAGEKPPAKPAKAAATK